MSSEFPSPIGGIPFPHDFAPALIFTILYALVVPLALWRMIAKSSRSLVILGATIFTVERIADFAIRAAEAEKPNLRTTSFFVGWLQSAYGMGYLSMAMDLGNLARLFVANALFSSPVAAPSAILPPPINGFWEEEQPLNMVGDARSDASSSYNKLPLTEREPFGNEARLHVVFKRIAIMTLVLRLAALTPAIASGSLYFNGTTNSTIALLVQVMRYGSALIVLSSQFFSLGPVIWALQTHPRRTHRKPALYLLAMISVVVIPTLYRLAAMRSYTHLLTDMGPGSLNGPTAKALFYTFHIAPEWISSVMLLAVNVKDMFGVTTTGH